MIRPGRAADTMAVIALMEEAKETSVYAEVGEISEDAARSFLARCVHLHGNQAAGGTLYLVSERDGRVVGFFVAVLSRVYIVGSLLAAQDVLIYMSEAAPPRDFARCVALFDLWAESNPKVIEAKLSTSDFHGHANRRLERIYEARGYEKTHMVMKKRIER